MKKIVPNLMTSGEKKGMNLDTTVDNYFVCQLKRKRILGIYK